MLYTVLYTIRVNQLAYISLFGHRSKAHLLPGKVRRNATRFIVGDHEQESSVTNTLTTIQYSDATTTRQTTHGPRQTMCRSHSPPTSRESNIASEGMPECCTPCNWTHTCYAMEFQMSSLTRHSGERACLSPTARPFMFTKA